MAFLPPNHMFTGAWLMSTEKKQAPNSGDQNFCLESSSIIKCQARNWLFILLAIVLDNNCQLGSESSA